MNGTGEQLCERSRYAQRAPKERVANIWNLWKGVWGNPLKPLCNGGMCSAGAVDVAGALWNFWCVSVNIRLMLWNLWKGVWGIPLKPLCNGGMSSGLLSLDGTWGAIQALASLDGT